MYKSYEEITEYLKKKGFQKRIDKLAKKYKDKNIILYGAGLTFDAITNNFDISKLNIIGLSDIKFKDNDEYKGYKTIDVTSIIANKPDIVLVAVHEIDIVEDYFQNNLFNNYGKFKYESFIKFSFIDLIKELLK